MDTPKMIFLTTNPPQPDEPDPNKAFLESIHNPITRRIVKDLLDKGYTCSRGLWYRRFRSFFARLRYFRNGNHGVLVVKPPPAGPSAKPPTAQDVNAFFGGLLANITNLLAGGFPLQDLHLPGGGNIRIPAWFLAAMRALGVNVHIDGDLVSRADPRQDEAREELRD